MTLPVIILAGGLATRLRPVTEKIPKSLVDVAGKPFIERQLDFLKGQGIEDIIICTGHLGNMIEDVVGDGIQFGLNVKYSYDGQFLLGTGGAIKNALNLVEDLFFVLYGDSFLPINFKEIEEGFNSDKYQGLMTIMKNDDKWDKSNVLYEDKQLIKYDKEDISSKMTYIDYGLSLLSKDLFKSYDADLPFDLSEVFTRLSLSQELQGFVVKDRFYEIGSHEGLRQTVDYFLKKGVHRD